MGFLKRLFSKKSKKNSKHDTNNTEDVPPTPSVEEQSAATLTPIAEGNDEDSEQEAVASRLLRSSSRRFEVVSELDYASLPPIREYFLHTFHVSD